MHEAMLPPIFHEELVRRGREREWRVWSELVERHIFPKRKSAKGLAFLVLARQMLESQDLKLRGDIPTDMFPMFWDIVQMHKRQILQAELDYTFIWIVISQTKSAPCQVQGH